MNVVSGNLLKEILGFLIGDVEKQWVCVHRGNIIHMSHATNLRNLFGFDNVILFTKELKQYTPLHAIDKRIGHIFSVLLKQHLRYCKTRNMEILKESMDIVCRCEMPIKRTMG